jgi:hypothetical protein
VKTVQRRITGSVKVNQLHEVKTGETQGYRTHEEQYIKKNIPWPQSASELYRSSDRSLSAKLVTAFVDRRCRVFKRRIPTAVISIFLERMMRNIYAF